MPFRTAHEVSGKIVRDLYESGRDFSSLNLADWQRYDPLFDENVFAAITPEAAVAARVTPQSTGPAAVAAALEDMRRWTGIHGHAP
jgi:argininosuccinate lyase